MTEFEKSLTCSFVAIAFGLVGCAVSVYSLATEATVELATLSSACAVIAVAAAFGAYRFLKRMP